MNTTLEKILKKHEEISTVIGISITSLHMMILIFTTVLTLIILFIGEKYALNKKTGSHFKWVSFNLAAVCVSLSGIVISLVIIPIVYSNKVDDWKQNYVYPYIEQLEKQTKEIEQLNLGFSKEKDDEIFKITYTEGETHSKNLIPVEVIYSEKGEAKIIKTNAKIKYDLKEDEKPYMEYIYLEEELPSLIKEGYFNLIIHTN